MTGSYKLITVASLTSWQALRVGKPYELASLTSWQALRVGKPYELASFGMPYEPHIVHSSSSEFFRRRRCCSDRAASFCSSGSTVNFCAMTGARVRK